MKSYRHRDLSIVELEEGINIITACDSCGSIGPKPLDELVVPAYITGAFATRVPLLEVLSTGAEVISVADCLCCEMEPTGKELIQGILNELALANVEPKALTGSTEENFPTKTTGIGVVVTGISKSKLKLQKCLSGDLVAVIGIPKVGAELNLPLDDEIVSYEDIFKLLPLDWVREIIPCGSKGIAYEAQEAAKYSGLKFVPDNPCSVDLQKTAGPATCAVVTLDSGHKEEMEAIFHNKVSFVGKIY